MERERERGGCQHTQMKGSMAGITDVDVREVDSSCDGMHRQGVEGV